MRKLNIQLDILIYMQRTKSQLKSQLKPHIQAVPVRNQSSFYNYNWQVHMMDQSIFYVLMISTDHHEYWYTYTYVCRYSAGSTCIAITLKRNDSYLQPSSTVFQTLLVFFWSRCTHAHTVSLVTIEAIDDPASAKEHKQDKVISDKQSKGLHVLKYMYQCYLSFCKLVQIKVI